jgi:hypothetical protein
MPAANGERGTGEFAMDAMLAASRQSAYVSWHRKFGARTGTNIGSIPPILAIVGWIGRAEGLD